MFKAGDTVKFDILSLNASFFDKLSDEEKIKYYGKYGYGLPNKLFTFICEHRPQFGHCVLMDMDNGRLLPMCHMSNFKLATEDQC